MSIDVKIRDVKHSINREVAKVSFLSSGKINKYEHTTGQEILPPNHRQIIEYAKFTKSPLAKAFDKQTNKQK